MGNYKAVLGIVAVVIGFIGYAPYIRDVLSGKTRPHAFSWLAWGILEAIAFFAQLVKGGGAGTWVVGTSVLICLFIAGIAFSKKDKQIKPADWVALGGAAIGITLWQITKNPLLAVISVTLADACAFIPTFRKSYYRPQEETLLEYGFSCVKWVLGILALGSFNLTTVLYPVSLVITNGAFVLMAVWRRRVVSRPGKS